MTAGDLETLKAVYEEFGRGDLSRTDFLHPEIESESFGIFPQGPTRVKGREQLSRAMAEWLGAWERPMLIEAEEFVESGDRILVMIRWKGKGKESGVEIEGIGAHLWTFEGGRAVRFDAYRDRDEARAAL